MSAPKLILLLHAPGDAPADLGDLRLALEAQGVQVRVRPCAEPYAAVLDDIAASDTVVYWR